jgi:flagellar motility protein MotE (MotC chaperone)
MNKSHPYGDFFKKAKGAKTSTRPQSVAESRPQSFAQKANRKDISDYSEAELRQLFKLDKGEAKRRKRKPKALFGDLAPLLHFFGLAILLVLATVLVVFQDEAWNPLSDIQIDMFVKASAQDQEKSSAKTQDQPANSSSDAAEGESGGGGKVELSEDEKLSHFANLNKRKEELDLREQELAELERELQNQREQVETRIEYLESVRREIAGVLQERVEMDEEKVAQLVDFYSNMKPGQAANIISKINEDLAIQVLSKMKKKNAAQILNMIEPGKARVLSEKFAGYRPKN